MSSSRCKNLRERFFHSRLNLWKMRGAAARGESLKVLDSVTIFHRPLNEDV